MHEEPPSTFCKTFQKLKKVIELKEIVHKQQAAINQLTTKCNIVSAVDADDANRTDSVVDISESSLPPAPTDSITSYAAVVASPSVLQPVATNPTLTNCAQGVVYV